jgi:hypothetical protein
MNESDILNSAKKFICSELGLSNVEIEFGTEDVGRSGSAMPLAPVIVYS